MATIIERTAQDGKTTTFQVKVRLKGYPYQTASFTRKKDAMKWGASIESALREGRYFQTAESKRHTLSDLIDRYIKEELSKRSISARKDRLTILKWWRQALGVYILSDLKPSLIVQQRERLLAEGRAPATVVKYLAILSHAFTLAIMEWDWMESSPVSKVRKPSLPPGRTRYLSDEERIRLLKACQESSSPYLYTVVVLALSTGMRLSEIMNLYWKIPEKAPEEGAWGVVHLSEAKLVLHNTKNRDVRVMPLLGHALECVRTLSKSRRVDTELLFPSKKKSLPKTPEMPRAKFDGHSHKPMDLRTPWETARDKAVLENFRFHDLRHSAASYLMLNKATLPEISNVLGHKTLQMTLRYLHLSRPHAVSVVGTMNDAIFSDKSMSQGSSENHDE